MSTNAFFQAAVDAIEATASAAETERLKQHAANVIAAVKGRLSADEWKVFAATLQAEQSQQGGIVQQEHSRSEQQEAGVNGQAVGARDGATVSASGGSTSAQGSSATLTGGAGPDETGDPPGGSDVAQSSGRGVEETNNKKRKAEDDATHAKRPLTNNQRLVQLAAELPARRDEFDALLPMTVPLLPEELRTISHLIDYFEGPHEDRWRLVHLTNGPTKDDFRGPAMNRLRKNLERLLEVWPPDSPVHAKARLVVYDAEEKIAAGTFEEVRGVEFETKKELDAIHRQEVARVREHGGSVRLWPSDRPGQPRQPASMNSAHPRQPPSVNGSVQPRQPPSMNAGSAQSRQQASMINGSGLRQSVGANPGHSHPSHQPTSINSAHIHPQHSGVTSGPHTRQPSRVDAAQFPQRPESISAQPHQHAGMISGHMHAGQSNAPPVKNFRQPVVISGQSAGHAPASNHAGPSHRGDGAQSGRPVGTNNGQYIHSSQVLPPQPASTTPSRLSGNPTALLPNPGQLPDQSVRFAPPYPRPNTSQHSVQPHSTNYLQSVVVPPARPASTNPYTRPGYSAHVHPARSASTTPVQPVRYGPQQVRSNIHLASAVTPPSVRPASTIIERHTANSTVPSASTMANGIEATEASNRPVDTAADAAPKVSRSDHSDTSVAAESAEKNVNTKQPATSATTARADLPAIRTASRVNHVRFADISPVKPTVQQYVAQIEALPPMSKTPQLDTSAVTSEASALPTPTSAAGMGAFFDGKLKRVAAITSNDVSSQESSQAMSQLAAVSSSESSAGEDSQSGLLPDKPASDAVVDEPSDDNPQTEAALSDKAASEKSTNHNSQPDPVQRPNKSKLWYDFVRAEVDSRPGPRGQAAINAWASYPGRHPGDELFEAYVDQRLGAPSSVTFRNGKAVWKAKSVWKDVDESYRPSIPMDKISISSGTSESGNSLVDKGKKPAYLDKQEDVDDSFQPIDQYDNSDRSFSPTPDSHTSREPVQPKPRTQERSLSSERNSQATADSQIEPAEAYIAFNDRRYLTDEVVKGVTFKMLLNAVYLHLHFGDVRIDRLATNWELITELLLSLFTRKNLLRLRRVLHEEPMTFESEGAVDERLTLTEGELQDVDQVIGLLRHDCTDLVTLRCLLAMGRVYTALKGRYNGLAMQVRSRVRVPPALDAGDVHSLVLLRMHGPTMTQTTYEKFLLQLINLLQQARGLEELVKHVDVLMLAAGPWQKLVQINKRALSCAFECIGKNFPDVLRMFDLQGKLNCERTLEGRMDWLLSPANPSPFHPRGKVLSSPLSRNRARSSQLSFRGRQDSSRGFLSHDRQEPQQESQHDRQEVDSQQESLSLRDKSQTKQESQLSSRYESQPQQDSPPLPSQSQQLVDESQQRQHEADQQLRDSLAAAIPSSESSQDLFVTPSRPKVVRSLADDVEQAWKRWSSGQASQFRILSPAIGRQVSPALGRQGSTPSSTQDTEDGPPHWLREAMIAEATEGAEEEIVCVFPDETDSAEAGTGDDTETESMGGSMIL